MSKLLTIGTGSEAKVSVAVRVRPLIERELNKEGTSINWVVDQNIIQQVVPNTEEPVGNALAHTFDHVFSMHENTKEVYSRVVSPIVEQAFSGFNGTVLCYGQTSSGKTFTLYGDEKEDGILSLTGQHLFKRITEDKDRTYIVRLGLLEIYNEKLSDLLSEDGVQKEVSIVEMNGCVVPKNLVEIEIFKPEDMLMAMQTVQKRRRVGETRLNQESSRSHTVMRILIESVPKNSDHDGAKVTVTNALLNFVDLAGSEKVSQTGAVGDRFKEATHINKSLSILSQVVMQLSQEGPHSNTQSQNMSLPLATPATTTKGNTTLLNLASNSTAKKRKYVNYRDSKLTRILQSSLSGNAYIAMICTVTPASIEETISTIRFAKTAKKIQTQPKANLTSGFEYQQKIFDLQQTLAGKANEIDDLKRRLDVFSKFTHTSLQDSKTAEDDLILSMADRRKTICPSVLPSYNRRGHSQQSHVSSLSLQAITEDGIFQIPNKPPMLSKKRSSCGDILSPFTSRDERFMMSITDANDQLIKLIDQGEKADFPVIQKLKQTDDAAIQTEATFGHQESKRLRLDTSSPLRGTPPSTLRLQRFQLRIACEEDSIEKAQLKEFHATEIEVLKEQVSSLQQALTSSEAKCREMGDIMEVMKKEAGEMTNMLMELKESLDKEVCDGSTSTDTDRDSGFNAGVDSHDVATETIEFDKNDIGIMCRFDGKDAVTETIEIDKNDIGIMCRFDGKDAVTETIEIDKNDIGIMCRFDGKDAVTETIEIDKNDIGVMCMSRFDGKDVATETIEIEKNDVGIMSQFDGKDVATETETIEIKKIDIGIMSRSDGKDVATETMEIDKIDIGIMSRFDGKDVATETETIEIKKIDIGIMCMSRFDGKDVATETETIEIRTNDIGIMFRFDGQDVATETIEISKNDIGIMSGFDWKDVATETIEIAKSDIGIMSRFDGKDVATETIEIDKNDIVNKSRFVGKDVATETIEIDKTDIGIMSRFDGQDVATETIETAKNDIGIMSRFYGQDVAIETIEIEKNDIGIMSRFYGQDVATETTEIKKNDIGIMSRFDGHDVAIETIEVEKNDIGIMSRFYGQEMATETIEIEKNDIGIMSRLYGQDMATETIEIAKRDIGIMSRFDGKDAATETIEIGTMPQVEGQDVGTETKIIEMIDFGVMTQLTAENTIAQKIDGTHFQSTFRQVNRQSQTDKETGYDAMVQSCKEMRIRCKTYQMLRDSDVVKHNQKLADETKKVRELESKIILKESEKENLRQHITTIEKAYKEEKPKKFQEVQCDLFKDLLGKAMQGSFGYLPQDYPRVDQLATKINTLQRTICSLGIERKKMAEEEEAMLKQSGEWSSIKPKKPALVTQMEEQRKKSLMQRSQNSATTSSRWMPPSAALPAYHMPQTTIPDRFQGNSTMTTASSTRTAVLNTIPTATNTTILPITQPRDPGEDLADELERLLYEM